MKLTTAALLVGCATSLACLGEGDTDPRACALAPRVAPTPPDHAGVYHGHQVPAEVPLSAAQLRALGSFGRCSGALIGSRWVLSARHCRLQPGDRFTFGGAEAASELVALEVVEVREHQSLDLALARLAAPATSVAPEIEPLAWLTTELTPRWLGRPVEAVGYGLREDGGEGQRRFVVEAIVALDERTFTIDGLGTHGLCAGDSGGPALVIADDATVRIAGVLSGGSITCLDRDHLARVDRAVDWLEAAVGPSPEPAPAGCGGVDEAGRCLDDGRLALYCDGDRLRAEACPAGRACGWAAEVDGFRCQGGADPCDGVDTLGVCADGVAAWCDAGTPRHRDCAACGERCVVDLAAGGATCAPDPCADLDERGRCEPDGTRVWCEGGERFEEPCAAAGATCRWLGAALGNQCAWP